MFISEKISEQTVVCLFHGIELSNTQEQSTEAQTADECHSTLGVLEWYKPDRTHYGLTTGKISLRWEKSEQCLPIGRKKWPGKEHEGVFWGWWKYSILKRSEGYPVILICQNPAVIVVSVPFNVCTSCHMKKQPKKNKMKGGS